MRNWNTGGLSLSRPKQEQQNSVWQYLISGWKSNAYLRQVTETWPSSPWTCCFMAWDTDFGRRCKHLYDQITNILCQAVHWNALESLNLEQVVTRATRTTKSSQTLVDHVINNLPKRVTHTDVLPCTLVSDHDASYVFVFVFVFFLINIYPGASNLAELVKCSPDTTQKQRH